MSLSSAERRRWQFRKLRRQFAKVHDGFSSTTMVSLLVSSVGDFLTNVSALNSRKYVSVRLKNTLKLNGRFFVERVY